MILTTSVEHIRSILKCAESCGFNSERICQNADFDISTLDKDGARISFFQYGGLLEALIQHNRDPYIGLHLGEKMNNFRGNILFILMQNAPTLNEAVEGLCRYYPILTDIYSLRFSVRGSQANLTLHYNTDGLSLHRHSNESILASMAAILYRLSEGRLRFNGVHFKHPKPHETLEHRRIFNAPIYFKQNKNQINFNSKYLGLPIKFSNQRVFEKLKDLAYTFYKELPSKSTLSEKVARNIFNSLGKESVSVTMIAEKLAINPRNLQDRLKQEGVTYQKILNMVRKEKCLDLLIKKKIPIFDIALILGYSEQSAFTRAFKKWFGLAPKEYRLNYLSKTKDSSKQTSSPNCKSLLNEINFCRAQYNYCIGTQAA